MTIKSLPRPLRRLLARVAVGLYGARLRRAARQADTVEEKVRVAMEMHTRYLRIRPMQVRSELVAFMTRVAELRPRRVLEIGTARGGTLFLFCQLAAADAVVVSVDLPAGRFGGGYPEWRAPLYRSFARGDQRLSLIRGDSHAPEVAERVRAAFDDRPIDLLFIDGDHTYEGVKADFERFAPQVAAGGLIAFHDVRPGPEARVGGVPRFWSELKARYAHDEILAPEATEAFGIGLLTPPLGPGPVGAAAQERDLARS